MSDITARQLEALQAIADIIARKGSVSIKEVSEELDTAWSGAYKLHSRLIAAGALRFTPGTTRSTKITALGRAYIRRALASQSTTEDR